MKKLLAMALAGALLVSSIGAVPAAAVHHKKFRTKVTIHFTQSTYSAAFFGKTKSKKAACRRHRKVKVIRASNGQLIASTKSNRTGDWTANVGGTPPAGDYFAKAKKKILKSGAICKKGKSPRITVP